MQTAEDIAHEFHQHICSLLMKSFQFQKKEYTLKMNYILIDFENVHVKSLALLKGELFEVRVFLGPKNSRLPVELVLAIQELGSRAEYIILESSGSNALDFHIAYYLGKLASEHPSGFFHIISKDTGFDPLVKHLKSRKIFCVRSNSIEDMPCFSKTSAEKAAAVGRAAKAAMGDKIADLVKVAIKDLIKRKAAKPRTLKTLRSTIGAKCGKGLSSDEIDAICEALIKGGYVQIDGQRILYKLPAEKA